MTENINPWEGMCDSKQRRAVADSPHDLFWVTDIDDKYGFMLDIKQGISDLNTPTEIDKIKIFKKNVTKESGKFILLLTDREDWEIFYSLCCDLISVTYDYKDDLEMVNAVELRLKKWQQLLRPGYKGKMDLSKQMGLFSELLCLKDIITPKVGTKQAITSWAGPDFDHQDFLLDKAILEIKSYKTSRGPTIKISSLGQLISDKISLFLVTYGLTPGSTGETIADIVDNIELLLNKESTSIQYSFSHKLVDYGYIASMNNSHLYSFIVDKIRTFLVTGGFPKILPYKIAHGVLKVKYSVDLLECLKYEKLIDKIL